MNKTVLFLYSSYSSGTQSAAEKVAEFISSQNHTVTLKRVTEQAPDPSELQDYDLVLLASPSWWVDNKDGQPHIHMKKFLLEDCASANLTGKKIAIFGLGDTSYAHFCGAVDVMEGFVKDHGAELAQPSLRIDSFYFNEEENTKVLLGWVNQLLN